MSGPAPRSDNSPRRAPRVRRLLAALLLVGVLVVVALVAALAWFGATAAGTRALFDRFAPLAAPMVRVGTVDGRLLGPLELHELVIALPAARVEVAQATLRWRPRALMRGTLAIVELAVSGVQVIVRESADEETPSSTLATPLLPPLPLALRVEALAVRDVTLADAPGRLVSLTLAATLDGDQVRLDDIALEAVSGAGEALVLGGEVALADGATPVLAATLGGRLEAAPPVSADIALSGPLSGLRVDARVEGAGPVPLTLGGQLDLLAAVPAFALALEADAVALGDAEEAVRIGPSLVGLNGSAAAFDLALDSRLERPGAAPRAINLAATVNAPDSAAGSGWRGTFEWHARAETGPWPQLGGDGEVSYTGAMLSVTHRGDAPLASRLEATLRELDATPLVDARLTAEGLDIPLENAQTLSLERLAAQAKGPLDRLAVTVVANGHQALGGRIALDLAGELGERHFTLERLAAELLGGQLQADGTLRFAPTPGGEVAFAASGLDLAYLDVALDSALAFSGTATFEQHDEQLRGTVALEELGGAWRGHAVAGRLNLEVDGAAARLRDAVLTLGDNRLEVNADIGETLTGRFDLRAPDLGKLAPGLQGELAASGSVGGSRTAPRVEAELAGRDLAGPAWSVASIAGDVALDLASTGAQRVDVTLRGVSAGGRALGELVLDADGTLDAHRLEATLSGGEPTLRLVANGAWQAPAWQGRIETLALGDTPLGDWVLRAPATLAASATRVDLGAACLVQAEARLCVALDEWLTDGGAATLDLAGLPLASFADYLPTTVRVRGELGGEARFTAATGGITGDARFAVSAAGVSVTRADGRTETVALEDTAVDVTLAPAALTARLRAALGDWLDVDGELRYGLTSDHALDGRFALRADQLAWLEEFVPQLAGTHGALALDATLGGDQARPAVTLETRLRDGAIVLPASGTRIAQLALDARTRDSRTLVVDGEFGDGEHVVTLAGRVELDARAGWPGRLEVRGEDFALLRQPDVEADISPDLALEFSTDHLAIGGRLALPHVLVTLSSLPPSAVAVSPDEVIIDDAAAPAAATPPADFFTDAVRGDVELVLGDAVRIQAAGLDARLSGGLRWTKQPGDRLGRGSGRVSIAEGGYRAYGQALSVERGHLIFAGPIDSPELDVRAVREDIDIVAGILVSGNVRAPRFELFSEPPLPDANILAWIITGHGLDSASSSEASLITSAALSLGAERSSMVTSQVRDAFGLDEFGINTGETARETSFSAGKRLTPKLSVRSEFNPFDRLMSFFLNYQLTPSWSVEAESGVRQGADLIYSIEREELLPEDPLDPRSWLE